MIAFLCLLAMLALIGPPSAQGNSRTVAFVWGAWVALVLGLAGLAVYAWSLTL